MLTISLGKDLLKRTTTPAVIAVWTSHPGMPAATTLVNRSEHDSNLFCGQWAPISKDILGQMVAAFSQQGQWILVIELGAGGVT